MAQDYLAHYGIKGMKWGIRRDRRKAANAVPLEPEDVQVSKNPKTGRLVTTGGRGHNPSEDAVKAAALRQKAKASGASSLSNKEIQELVTRLDLEGKYAKAMAANAPPKSAGRKFLEDFVSQEAKKYMKTGKTPGFIQAIINLGEARAAKKTGTKATTVALKAIGSQTVKSTVVK